MSRWWACGIVFALVVACGAGHGQDRTRGEQGKDKGGGADKVADPTTDKAVAVKEPSTVVPLRSGAGKELATLLNAQFDGRAKAEFLPDLNVLIVTASPNVLAEAAKVVAQYDRPQRSVAVEILVVDLPPMAAGPENAEFSGPVKDVHARLETLRKTNKISSVKQIQLTALENQTNAVLVGESRPFVMGRATTGTGITTSSITYRNLGIKVGVKPHLSAEGKLTLDLDLEESRPVTPEDAPALGPEEKDKEKAATVRAPTFQTNTVKGSFAIPEGQAVLAKGFTTSTKAGDARTLVLVTATVAGK